MYTTTAVLRSVLLGLLVHSGAGSTPSFAAESPEGLELFEKRIRPLFTAHCYECHSTQSKKSKGGLQLDSPDGLRKGGDSGPALVPGEPEKSLLVRAVRHMDEALRMPPKQKLSETEIADLVTWVKMGAPDPRGAVTVKVAARIGMSLDEGRKFWSFQPVRDMPVPSVKDAAWPRTSVDHFILARLEAAGVAPAPDADRRTLLRRVTFDLTGLPPTPAEMTAFLADNEPDAFARVVDRLLASSHYGERWGRHWLDVVRYADTCGNASDYPVPQAHRYRDWVIAAFNRDLPYDQFLREQIAGDLLPGGSEAERQERIIATGYLACARRFGGDRMGEHHLTLEDTIDNLGRALLGCSISCARCHDHKFDPFTMSDYYGLYGILSSTRYPFPGAEVKMTQEDFVPLKSATEIEALLKPHRDKIAALDAEIKKLEIAEAEMKKAPDSADKKERLDTAAKSLAEAKKQRLAAQAAAPVIDSAYAVADGKGVNAKMHVRGDPKRLGEEVPRHFPAVLGGQEARDATGSGRLQLADWLTDPKNPLPARVMVNRIWQHHFGKGIVPTPNDFGRQGQAPTHPELLDFLAARFIESGWSVKALHRLILLSRTWQLSSADGSASEPTNELFGRFMRRRLDAESIRDALLFVSGDLDQRLGGSHPFPPMPAWKYTQHAPFVAVYPTRQRSVYLMQSRLRKNPYLALFDGADPSSSTGARLPSTTPLQALFLMNDSLVHDLAAKFARRILAIAADDPARLTSAYQLALSRPPGSEEQQECAEFLQQYRARLRSLNTPADQLEAQTWAALSRALLSANEFVFVD
jgi:hypothetical protein